MAIGAVMLAAGAASRLGRPKQLLPFRGRPLLRAMVEQVTHSRCDRVLVVLGAHIDAIAPAMTGLAIDIVSNADWAEGMASSIRCGVRWASLHACSSVILLVGDQPALTTDHVDRLIDAHDAGAMLVASRYGGSLGVPALFDRRWFAALGALRGDAGAKHVIRGAPHVAPVDFDGGAADGDTQEDADRLADGMKQF